VHYAQQKDIVKETTIYRPKPPFIVIPCSHYQVKLGFVYEKLEP
jgi:hypothetical protein